METRSLSELSLRIVVENSQSKHRVEPSDLDLGKESHQLATRSD